MFPHTTGSKMEWWGYFKNVIWITASVSDIQIISFF